MGCAASSGKVVESEPRKKNDTKYKETPKEKGSNRKKNGGEAKRTKLPQIELSTAGGRFKPELGPSDHKAGRKDKRKEILSSMNKVSQFDEELTPYVPWAVLKQFKEEPTPQTSFASFPGVVMLVDITGYTRLGESLSKMGMLGVELLASYINGYFTELISVVHEYGGSVERFAGDALIVIFGSPYTDTSIETLSTQAVNCACSIQKRYPKHPLKVSIHSSASQVDIQDTDLTVHIAIASSVIKTITVGGLGDSWRKLLFGEAFDQLAITAPLSASGEVVLSKQCHDYIQHNSSFENLKTEPRGDQSIAISLKEGCNVAPGRPLPKIPITTAMEKSVRAFVDLFVQSRIDEGQPEISETRTISMLFMGINNWNELQQDLDSTRSPGFIAVHQLIRSIQNIVYTYEGCIANCLVDEKGLSVIVTYGIPQHTDDSLLAIKSALEIKESSEKFGVGISIGVTTGETFIGTIGSSERKDYTIMGNAVNLGARLMTMARKVYEECDDVDGPSPRGSAMHCQRDLGNAVVKSSRWSQIVADEKTFNLTKKRCLFQADIEPLNLRGVAEPVKVFVPVKLFKGRKDFYAHQNEGDDSDQGEDEERQVVLISRAQELQTLENVRSEVLSDAIGLIKTRVVFVNGEGGMGKSYLVRILAGPIEKGELPGTWIEASPNEGDSTYNLWEPVFNELLFSNLVPGASKLTHLTTLLKSISTHPDWDELGYLNLDVPCYLAMLNPVIKTNFRNPTELEDLGAMLKAKTTITLLHNLLKHFSRQNPLFIFFDQMEACSDAYSYQLLLQLAESKDKRNSIMVICSQRPFSSMTDSITKLEVSRTVKKIGEFPSTTTMNLAPLTQSAATTLFIHLLNAQLQSHKEIPEIKEVDPDLAYFVYKNSQNGKTYLLVAIVNAFKEQLLQSDRRKDGIMISGNKLFISGSEEIMALHLPQSVTHFARSTIDRLPPTQQLIVKYSSVVGRKFSLDALDEVFPNQTSRNTLLHGILKLVEGHIFAELKTASGNSMYRFVDSVMFDEAYSMVLLEQRRTIHRKLADWTEKIVFRNHDDEQSPEDTTNGIKEGVDYNQLARHWCAYVKLADEQSSFEEVDRAVWCLRKYVSQLFNRGEYTTAYDMLVNVRGFLPLLVKKSTDSEADYDEMEVQILYDMVKSVNHARLKFSKQVILKLYEAILTKDCTKVTDSIWQARYSALCLKSIELSTSDYFTDAKSCLLDLGDLTKESGGEIESVIYAWTQIRVLMASVEDPKEVIQTAKDTINFIKTMKDPTVFNCENLSPIFSGLSSGHPYHDLLLVLRLLFSLQANLKEISVLDDPLNSSVFSGKGVNEPRLHCMLSSLEYLSRNYDKAKNHAEQALNLCSKVSDHFGTAFSNFNLSLCKGAFDQAASILKTLESSLGCLRFQRCILLQSALRFPDASVTCLTPFLTPPPADALLASEELRLQAFVLMKLVHEDEVAVERFTDQTLPGGFMFVAVVQAESLLITAAKLANQKHMTKLYCKALAGIITFWGEARVLSHVPGASALIAEFCRVKEQILEFLVKTHTSIPACIVKADDFIKDRVIEPNLLFKVEELQPCSHDFWLEANPSSFSGAY